MRHCQYIANTNATWTGYSYQEEFISISKSTVTSDNISDLTVDLCTNKYIDWSGMDISSDFTQVVHM